MRNPRGKTQEQKLVARKALANRIAGALMRDYDNKQAVRLQLRGPGEEDLGGLCRQSVEKIIEAELLTGYYD